MKGEYKIQRLMILVVLGDIRGKVCGACWCVWCMLVCVVRVGVCDACWCVWFLMVCVVLDGVCGA